MPAASGTRWSRKAPAAASAAGRRRCASARKGRAVALTTLSGDIEDAPRIATGISELDRATGGGFVRGSALLVGGDPGIGKSTLLTQAAAALAGKGHRVVYVSGEEAVAQIRLRAQRLGVADAPVELAAETNVEDILATIADGKRPDLVILDSIQTLWTDIAEFGAGHGHAGARLGAGDDPLRQVDGRGDRAGRPRHQGRPDRRPARRRAHGRRGALFRGRRRPPLPHPAHREEPLRADRRDRRVRNVGQGPARGRQPVGAVPRRAQRESAGRGGLCRHGRHAAGAGRDPGAGGALAARHAAPRRRRLGLRAAVDGARRARGALRRPLRARTTSISTSPAATASPSRRPISRSLLHWFRRSPVLPFPPIASISAKSAFPGPSGRLRMRSSGSRKRKSWGLDRPCCLPARRNCRAG